MARLRYSLLWVRELAKSLRFVLAVAVLDGLAGAATFFLTSHLGPALRTVVVIAATVVGILAALSVLVAWAFLTAPRHLAEERLTELEDAVESQRAQIATLIGEQWGDPDQFVPVYHDLGADLREAIRKVERAKETGQLWAFIDRLDDNTWKKNREQLANHPWAKADHAYGPCAEAFGHIDRLNTLSSTR